MVRGSLVLHCDYSGHDWLQLIGGRRCIRCGEQEARGESPLVSALHFYQLHQLLSSQIAQQWSLPSRIFLEERSRI
jgi:hypothetical protein